MIKLSNVTKIYCTKKNTTTIALKDINLQFPNKGMVFVCGKSGSGKSTLLNIIGGLDYVSQGSIEVDNQVMNVFTSKEYDSYRNTYVGFIFQEFNLVDEYTVRGNIEMALKLQDKKVTEDILVDALSKVGMDEYLDRYTNELSGGQKQRIAIARAIIKQNNVILADEPTGALDVDNGKVVFELLKDLSKTKLVIVVTHDKDAAKAYGDRIIELEDGLIISDSCANDCSSEGEKYKTTKTKLPFLYALNMGWKSLKYKKIRLFISCLLLCVSLTLMGIASLLSNVDTKSIVTNSVIEDNASIIGFRKNYNDKAANYRHYNYITDSDLAEIDKEIKFLEYDIPVNGYICQADNSIYDKATFHSIIEINNKNDLKDFGYELFENSKEITNWDEVYITDFLAEALLKTEEYRKLEKSTDLIGERVACNFVSLKIVGVVDTGYVICENSRIEEYNRKGILGELSEELNSLYGIIFARSRAIESFYNAKFFGMGKTSNILAKNTDISENLFAGRMSVVLYPYDNQYIRSMDCNEENSDYVMIFGKSKDLGEDEIIVSPQVYIALTNTEEQQLTMKKIEDLDENLLNVKVRFNFTGNYNTDIYNVQKEKEYTIVGIIINAKYKTMDDVTGDVMPINTSLLNVADTGMIVSEKIWNRLLQTEIGIISKFYIQAPSKSEDIKQMIDSLNTLGYRHEYKAVSNLLYGVEEYTDVISVVFMYFSIVMFIFVILLLSNYINISIAHRKKEIGILRSIGARSIDISKIFLLEGIIIAAISALMSIVCEAIVSSYLNEMISKAVNISIEFIHVYAHDILLIFGIAILISILSTFISIRKISKQKPVDIIRCL